MISSVSSKRAGRGGWGFRVWRPRFRVQRSSRLIRHNSMSNGRSTSDPSWLVVKLTFLRGWLLVGDPEAKPAFQRSGADRSHLRFSAFLPCCSRTPPAEMGQSGCSCTQDVGQLDQGPFTSSVAVAANNPHVDSGWGRCLCRGAIVMRSGVSRPQQCFFGPTFRHPGSLLAEKGKQTKVDEVCASRMDTRSHRSSPLRWFGGGPRSGQSSAAGQDTERLVSPKVRTVRGDPRAI
ncbi:hypothetical protein VTO42DRAFT_8690 [Malbranchea cinnamomea]